MEIRFGHEASDFDRVHPWLASTYWSPGISRELVEKAAQNSSLVVNAYDGDAQVGYLRVISDRATFAWICDVYVDESARRQGVALTMLTAAQSHPDHQGFRRWVLATKDAHPVYAKVGYEPLPEPSRWMIRVPK